MFCSYHYIALMLLSMLFTKEKKKKGFFFFHFLYLLLLQNIPSEKRSPTTKNAQQSSRCFADTEGKMLACHKPRRKNRHSHDVCSRQLGAAWAENVIYRSFHSWCTAVAYMEHELVLWRGKQTKGYGISDRRG